MIHTFIMGSDGGMLSRVKTAHNAHVDSSASVFLDSNSYATFGRNQQEHFMRVAITLADKAVAGGDVPVGALVFDEKARIIGQGWNARVINSDPSAHAEIVAMREAGHKRGTWNLTGCTLVVTLEPCTMCAGAIVQARISRVVFGAWDEKAGASGSVRDVLRDSRLNHTVEVIGGVCEKETAVQLRGFFNGQRG